MKISAPSFSRFVAGLSLLAFFAAAGAAHAQSCQEDFQKLTDRRMAQIQALNAIGKAGKGKMDPNAACPVAKKLVSVESEMAGYMTKNKEWCNIPDNVLDGFKQAASKTKVFASQACTAAAKMKQMEQQQREQAASGGGMAPPKLPSGPL
ncbi:hypothetical protein [Methylocystis echinoides]|jgi:hypothetical protein|uniref:hypothetical protein n=1 Tax=Methylocystis echinoides TaxID=29468 RepID=UPI003449EB2F